jgi:hypothetical protein
MPCAPAKARHLFKSGKAKPKRNKLGLFYVQLDYEQKPDNQPLVAGVDPGSKFEGYSVVGTKETVLNLMVEAPDHVKDVVETRRTMRRARRYRLWRRAIRFDNRLGGKKRIPPSTRSRWEAKARVIAQVEEIHESNWRWDYGSWLDSMRQRVWQWWGYQEMGGVLTMQLWLDSWPYSIGGYK